MDIRTRLIFTLVAISLGSMVALGGFAYGAVQDLLLRTSLRQLEAVVTSKEQDLQRVLAGWLDEVRLFTSRTQLRISLASLGGDDDAEHLEKIERILRDAWLSVDALRGIELYTADGRRVARAGFGPGSAPAPTPDLAELTQPRIHGDVVRAPDGRPLITFVAPLELEGRRVGSALLQLSASELAAVTADYTGLGETGETLVVRPEPDGSALVLSPLRHDPDAALRRRITADKGLMPALEAVRGVEGSFRDAVDYRGERVYAATRWLPDLGWGVVAKIDASEERGAILELRNTLLKLALSLSALGIVAGTALGLAFARPIRELAEVARRVGNGEWDLRAEERSEDEVGQLAVSFNRMTEQLVAANRELERRLNGGPGKDPPS